MKARNEVVRGRQALPRPGDTLVNKLVYEASSRRPYGQIDKTHVSRWLKRSLRSVELAGGDCGIADHLASHAETHWEISEEPIPDEVWCGEVLWPQESDQDPLVKIYPNSPMGRMPQGPLLEVAGQTGVDHIVSHLYHWFAGQDYSETVASADQIRFMWGRKSVTTRLAATAIFVGIRLHKQIPMGDLATQLKRPFHLDT